MCNDYFRFCFADRSSYVDKVLKEDIKENSDVETPLRVRDRIVWLSDNGPEYGVVKWIGVLPEADVQEVVAGIEFVSDSRLQSFLSKSKARKCMKLQHAKMKSLQSFTFFCEMATVHT